MVVNKRATSLALALALMAIAGIVLMPRLNEATSRAVREGMQGFRARIDAGLGLTVSFDSLSPSILSSASFSGLAIKAPDGRPLLTARRVRVLYNLFAILRGRSSEAITGLELADVNLDLRLPEDDALLSRLSSLVAGDGGGGGDGTVPRFVLSGKNVVAKLSVEGLGSASFVAREAGLSTFEEEPVVTLDGRFYVEPKGVGPWPISGPLSLSGSISRDFKKARANLALAADSRDFSLAMQRFELSYGNDVLTVTKVKDRAPLDAAVRIDLAGGESSASLKFDGFVPSRSLGVSGRFASFEPWLDIPYRGSIFISARVGDSSKLSYEAELSGSLPAKLLGGESNAVRAELRVKGDGEGVVIEKARAERGTEFVDYKGSFRFGDLSPDGVLDLNLALKGGSLPLSTSVRLVGHGGEYAAIADQVLAGGVEFKDFTLAARRKGAQTDFNLSFAPPEEIPSEDQEAVSPAFSGEAGASGGLPLVRCEGTASFGGDPGFELSVDLNSVDLGPMRDLISAIAGSPDVGIFLSKLKLDGSLFATSDFKRLSWSAPDLTIVSRTSPGTYALLALSGTTTSMAVKKAVISLSGRTIEGAGKVDFSESGRLAFEAKLDLLDTPLSIQGSVDGGDVSISGDYGLSASIRNQGDERRFALRTRALPVPVGGGLYLATVDAEGRFASEEDWYLMVSEISLAPAGDNAAVLPKIDFAGAFGPRSAALSNLRLEDKYSKVSGAASLEYSLGAPASARIRAKLSSPLEPKASSVPESYDLDLSYAEGKVLGTVDFLASPIARLGKLPVSGYVDGKLTVKGNPADPDLDFKLALRDGRLDDQSLALSGSGSYGRGNLNLRGISAAYQGHAISGGTVFFSFTDARAELSMAYAGSFNDEDLKFVLVAGGASTKADPRATLPERFASYEATGALKRFTLGGQTVDEWPFRIRSDSGTLSFVGGQSEELRVKYAPGGLISASIRDPLPLLPLRAEVSCLYDGKNIDLAVQGLEFDVAALQPFMPDIIKLKGGKAHGGFRAVGLANDPEISGEVDLVGASVRVVGWVGEDIGPFNAPLLALGRKFEVSVPAAPSGKALIALGFQATVDHWLPTGIDAFARTTKGTFLQLDAVILGIHAQGEAAADVRFTYPGGNTLRIDTDVAIQKGSVVVSTETLQNASEGGDTSRPSLYFNVAAKVRFARGIQVYFPSTTFPIVAGYSDPSSSLAILYDQEAADFSLKGTVALRGGEVFYVQRNFFLKNGKIVFNEGSDRFEPRVTLLAELRDRNEAGPVKITLKAENAPISTFKPTMSSDPVMSEAEIAAMMGQNVFGSEGEKSVDIRTTAISASEFIPQLDVARIFENKIRDAAGLDIFYLRTQVLQNWLIDMSQSKADSNGNPLGRYFDRTSIYAGKYLDDSIFTYGSIGIRESTPLVGSTTSIINYGLGVELDAPFGRITWALAPEDWKTLTFRDQSLSLSWKLAY
jgi:translocation and assembly module TamB